MLTLSITVAYLRDTLYEYIHIYLLRRYVHQADVFFVFFCIGPNGNMGYTDKVFDVTQYLYVIHELKDRYLYSEKWCGGIHRMPIHENSALWEKISGRETQVQIRE